MKIQPFWRAFLLAPLFLASRVAWAQTPSPTALALTSADVSGIFFDKGDADLEAVRNAALAQTTEPSHPFYKSPVVETRSYEGFFQPTSDNSKLALLSDDGTSMWIDGEQVLNHADKGQGFEDFDSTFQPLATSFKAGQIYHLRLKYTNTIHSNDGDMDGITLFAYNGGGTTVKPSVKLTGEVLSGELVRLCAGGIDDHSSEWATRVHTAKVTATFDSGSGAWANQDVTLRFSGDKAHDFGSGTLEYAEMHADVSDWSSPWERTLTLRTDEAGKITFWVKGSDVIGEADLIFDWKNSSGRTSEIGKKPCEFDAAEMIRRFANPFDEEETEDGGWIFDVPVLSAPDATTPAKVYLKYLIDPALGDVDGNWKVVNGHRLLVKIDGVTLHDGTEVTDAATIKNHAVVIDGNNSQGETRMVTTSADGAAQAVVQAKENINDTNEIVVGADNLTQWDN